MSRPSKIIIDLRAIEHNCSIVSGIAKHSEVVAMVKADAYGHGIAQVAKAIEPLVAKLGVCCLEEAQAIRQAGISKPIVLIEGCFEAQEYVVAASLNCEIVVHTEEQVQQLIAFDGEQAFTVWLKVDTGMHRLGFALGEIALIYQQLLASDKVAKLILMSHFANADEINNDFTQQQIIRFTDTINSLSSDSSVSFDISLANSAAILAWPQSHGDWVRPGIMLYGISPFNENQIHADKLRPAMTFCSKVIALREINIGEMVGYGNKWQAQRPSLIATVAAGYGDGYPRTAAVDTPVWINGHKAQLAGRVSMDMLTVDVTDVPGVAIGDTVELWGVNIPVNDVAELAGSNGYELVTRMPRRTPRIYR